MRETGMQHREKPENDSRSMIWASTSFTLIFIQQKIFEHPLWAELFSWHRIT